MSLQPDNAVCRENGGGGNRTRVGFHSESDASQGKAGWVYLITDGVSYKIGHARNPEKRLSLLQTGHPEELRLLAVIEGSPLFEREIHEVFSGSRFRGEWFFRSNEILSFFEERGFLCTCRRVPDPDCFIHADGRTW